MQAFGLYTVDNKHEMYNTNLFPLKFKHLLLPLKLCIANQMNALCIVFHSAIISLIFCMFAKTIFGQLCVFVVSTMSNIPLWRFLLCHDVFALLAWMACMHS